MSLTNNSKLDEKLLSLGWTKQQLDMYLDELYIHRSTSQLVEDFLYCCLLYTSPSPRDS